MRGSFSSGTCTSPGCQSYNFTSATGSTDTFSISNCVTERTGTNAYTDVAPSTAPLGPNYPASTNPCLPLTSDKTLLENQIETSFRTVDASEVGEDGHVMKGGIAFTVNASDQPAK